MRYHKRWTPEETEYLEESWGSVSISKMASNLERTEYAIKCRAYSLGLGNFLESGDYILFAELLKVLTGQRYQRSYKTTFEKRGLPIHRRRVQKQTYNVVFLNEFWKWAEAHRMYIDFSRVEPLSLGIEPAWVDEQRKADGANRWKQSSHRIWTQAEDQYLEFLLRQERYTAEELTDRLGHPYSAINRRRITLGIPYHPVQPHIKKQPWTEEQIRTLDKMMAGGQGFPVIGKALNRSDAAVIAFSKRRYGSGVPDRMREAAVKILMNGGNEHGT